MENINGYFQVIRGIDGISIKLFPERGTGNKIDINEIMEYLDINKVLNCSFVELGKALKNLKKEETVFISSHMGYPINEYMKITVSSDQMIAKVRFYPPSNDGDRMEIDEMKRDLEAAEIKYGIDERVFMVMSRKPIYCTDFVVAKGKKVREGSNAVIEYLFNTDRKIKPKHNEDGSVDFHQLNNISHINIGDTLAVLHPADSGECGFNVRGEEIKPRPVENKVLKFGKNIELSEDKLKIFSKVNGHAILEGERVFVSNSFDVPGDVDNSTGDIDYEGNVVVHGNVRTGFKIKAAGDVEVFGSVEGAEIISGGQVVLHHGMQGMAKGKIIARGNVVTRFVESSKIYSEGYIESEAIIQSQISAKGDIIVNGQRGHIIGGRIRTSSTVEAKRIGSGMGISTIIEVGFDPEQQDKIKNIRTELSDKNEEYKKNVQRIEVLNKRLGSGMIKTEQKIELRASLLNAQKIKEELFNLQEELDKLIEKMSDNTAASVTVHGEIYPGTQLIVAGEYYNVIEELSYCKFHKINGEIKVTAL